MVRLTTGSKPLVLWFETLPTYITVTLRSLSHTRTRMQPTKDLAILTARLSLVRGTSCERLKKCHHLTIQYPTIAYGTYNSWNRPFEPHDAISMRCNSTFFNVFLRDLSDKIRTMSSLGQFQVMQITRLRSGS